MTTKRFVKFINKKMIKDCPKSGMFEKIFYANFFDEHEDILLKMGYKPLVLSESKPENLQENQRLDISYEERSDAVYEIYTVIELVKEISDRKLSKMKLFEALYKRGFWEITESMIKSDVYTNKIWELAVTLQEQHPLVQTMITALKSKIGISNEVVEEIISESVSEMTV